MKARLAILIRGLAVTVFALTLAACSKGIDRKFDSADGDAAYRASLEQVVQEAGKQDLEAFNWAVSDLNLQALNARYPNRTPRDVIRGEVAKVLREFPPVIAQRQAELKAWQTAADKIVRVQVEGVSFALEKDFFGLQPVITATVRNASPHAYSSYGWVAYLYLDDQREPVADADVSVRFGGADGGGGFDPGQSATARMTVGFVTGERTWTTLEVQRAGKRSVKLVPRPQDARDLGERAFVGPSPADELARLTRTLDQARAYRQI